PAGQARRPASGLPPGAHDENVLGALEGALPRRLVARLDVAGPAAGPLEIGHAPPRVLDEELADVALAPAALAEEVRVLAREHHQRLVEAAEVGRAEMAEGVGEAAKQRLRPGGELVVDLVKAVRGVDGHRAPIMRIAALDVEGLPRMGL